MAYTKISNTEMQITMPQPDKTDVVTLDKLNLRLNYNQSLLDKENTRHDVEVQRLQNIIDATNTDIAQAAQLGLKTAADVAQTAQDANAQAEEPTS